MVKIAPSILSADFMKLGEEIQDIVDAGADWVHLDVMDGHFVPNMTFGAPIIKNIRKITSAFLDAHLMVFNPGNYYEDLVKAGVNLITIQAEAVNHLDRELARIKEFGIMAGVALNPHTPLCYLDYILDKTDLILIMSVNPGFGGQKFIPSIMKKIKQTRALIDNSNREILLQVDGGVNTENSKELIKNGVDVLVAGSAVFNKENYKKAIAGLR